MEFKTFTDAHQYLHKVESFLMRREAVNNLPLGLVYRIAKGTPFPQEPFMALVEDKGNPILVMVMTPPHGLVLYGEGDQLHEAVSFAVEQLFTKELPIPSVVGPNAIANAFAEQWERRTGISYRVSMKQRIYELRSVNPVEGVSGYLRKATTEEVPLVTQWLIGFTKLALEEMSYEDAKNLAESSVANGTAFFWDDNGPVSMAKRGRETKHGVVVNSVYTPPEQQRKGYASACVASLSQHILDEGYQFCSLYTDLTNPTSNSIYMKIGYQPVEDSIHLTFNKQA